MQFGDSPRIQNTSGFSVNAKKISAQLLGIILDIVLCEMMDTVVKTKNSVPKKENAQKADILFCNLSETLCYLVAASDDSAAASDDSAVVGLVSPPVIRCVGNVNKSFPCIALSETKGFTQYRESAEFSLLSPITK